MRLKRGIVRTISIGAPRIELHSTDHSPLIVGYTFALGHRIFVHPVDSVLLDGQQTAARVNITTLPATAAVDLGHNLTAQNCRAKVVGCSAILSLLNAQPIAVVFLA